MQRICIKVSSSYVIHISLKKLPGDRKPKVARGRRPVTQIFQISVKPAFISTKVLAPRIPGICDSVSLLLCMPLDEHPDTYLHSASLFAALTTSLSRVDFLQKLRSLPKLPFRHVCLCPPRILSELNNQDALNPPFLNSRYYLN